MKTKFLTSVILHLQGSLFGSMIATRLLVTHVGPCEKRSLVTVQEFVISTRNYDSTLSGEFNVSEDIANGWTVKGTMQKCQDIRNTDTCDHFRSFWAVRAGCASSEDAVFTLFQYSTPRLECPVRAGSYKLQDYPIFTADSSPTVLESKISTSVFGYLLLLEGSDVNKRSLFCVEAYLQLLYLRPHNWLSRRKNHTAPQPTTPSDDDDE